MADIDAWHARDLIAPLFFNDNTELHNLVRKRLILPYLTGSFHPSFIEEYASVSSTLVRNWDTTVFLWVTREDLLDEHDKWFCILSFI